MTGKSETACEYPAITCGSNVERYQTSDDFRRCDHSWRTDCGLQVQCQMKVVAPQSLEGKWGVDGTWIDPKLLIAGRKEEMEYTRKIGVFEVVDEKVLLDNGCKPLKLKWVDKMKGEKCRSRLVCREIKRAKDRDEQLQPEDVFLTHAAVGGVEDPCVHDDDRTR